MKILCSRFSNALYHIGLGWAKVCQTIDVEWHWWPQGVAAHQVFKDVEPDLFIGATYELDRATLKCIDARPEMKVLLKGNNFGELKVDTDRFPIGVADDNELRTCEKLRKEGTYVFNFYHEADMPRTMGWWESELGLGLVPMQPAADIHTYYPTKSRPELQCDIGFVGGYWGYKGQNINKFLLPLCDPVGKYNIKIFGNQPWPVAQYCGLCDDATANALFSSALIGVNVSEPHANEYGFEVNERPFKLAAAGCFCISDPISNLTEHCFTDNEIPVYEDAEELEDMVYLYTRNPELRQEHIDKAYSKVMSEHTYYNRMAHMFGELGFIDEARACAEVINVL